MQINLKLDLVVAGYALAAIIFCLALATASKIAYDARGFNGDGSWAALSFMVTPLALSFLIAIITEAIREMRNRNSE